MPHVTRNIRRGWWLEDTVAEYTLHEKLFYLYLITGPRTSQLGIYKLPKRVISFETGFDYSEIDSLIEKLSNEYKIIAYDFETNEVATLDSLKFTIVKGGQIIEGLIDRELSNAQSLQLIEKVYDRVLPYWTVSKRQTDKTIQQAFEDEIKRRKSKFGIDSENRDWSLATSLNDTQQNDLIFKGISETTEKDQNVLCLGSENNIFLTREQYASLKEAFPDDLDNEVDWLSINLHTIRDNVDSHFVVLRDNLESKANEKV